MDVKMLSNKISKFGVIGAGVIPDPLAALRLAQTRDNVVTASLLESPQTVPASIAPLSPPPASTESVVVDASSATKTVLTRAEILAILAETVQVGGIQQKAVSALARSIANERETGDKKKKKQQLSFVEGYKRIQELSLPKEPLELRGLTESSFQKILASYENDGEVMDAASKLLQPANKTETQRSRSITMGKIIEIHSFMVGEMHKVLQDFMRLSHEERRRFSSKGCEMTAELLVTLAVEQKTGVLCEDVEQAVVMYEEHLSGNPEFGAYTEQLANMMQLLIGAAQPRVGVSEFIRILRHMKESSTNAKAFAKKLYDDYRAKSCDIAEAYRRFESFTEESAKSLDCEDLPELSSVEMQLCYDEYRHNEEVRAAWDQAGAGNSLAMQAMMSGGVSPPSFTADEKLPKGKKLKSSEIGEMQELMVDELKRTTDALGVVVSAGVVKTSLWKADIVVQMVQALASAAVERRFGVSAEEMTMAGFQNANMLQRNERFVRATEKQQDLLMLIPKLCGCSEGE